MESVANSSNYIATSTMTGTREGPPQNISLLRASAEGVKFLVLLQISSRLLTFIVNQALLRYLSQIGRAHV